MSDRPDVKKAHEVFDAKLLERLGFGPDTVLMTDPKLFVDEVFLSALLSELDAELGPEVSAGVLFQIGLMHGLRDAEQAIAACERDGARSTSVTSRSTSLALELGPASPATGGSGMEMVGHWPESHEAEARLKRLGLSRAPSCRLSAGYTTGWLSGTTDCDLIVVEIECRATGGNTCRFEAREPKAWLDDPRGTEIIGLELDSGLNPFRDKHALPTGPPQALEDALEQATKFDASEKAVHIWGPVMILPFTNTNEVLATIEMLGRDPNTCSIRAVVIDLSDIILDDGLMAAGLEQALDTIEAWGAESILAGVSPLSEHVIEGLEARHLLTRKDLPEAIASAFQITDAQRHLL